MEIRTATAEDGPAIRSVAERSLSASYSLSPGTIESAVQEWYGEGNLGDRLDDPDRTFLVAERGEGDVVGFVEGVLVDADVADILWLHVDPDYRDLGIGSALFDHVRDALAEAGADRLRGRVLEQNVLGNDFYERQGFERVGETTVEIDGDRYTENVYAEPREDVWTAVDEDGEEVYIDPNDASRGSAAPFYAVHADADGERLWGYYCTNCESLATAMGAMGEIECGDCGNTRKPTRWDAAYL